ncbi:MAG: hypothetical protein M3Q33_07385 [Acidobacteriota bacterium]|nr:hypothetical protein [Acidobacteriota bacterium]
MDVISSILHKEPIPLSRHKPDVPREIERIVGKALRKDCEERYQTAKDLLIDLKDARQELEFQNKLEQSSAPHREKDETQIINEAATDAAHTASSAEYIAAEIKNHKFGFAALSVLLLVFLKVEPKWNNLHDEPRFQDLLRRVGSPQTREMKPSKS